jgi:hypothetical protein
MNWHNQDTPITTIENSNRNRPINNSRQNRTPLNTPKCSILNEYSFIKIKRDSNSADKFNENDYALNSFIFSIKSQESDLEIQNMERFADGKFN